MKKVCALALVAGFGVSVASADITEEVLTLRATNADGKIGAIEINLADGWFDSDGTYHWQQGDPMDVAADDGTYLGTLSDSAITIFEDPIISLNFNVQASNQNTIFQIDSGILSFAQIVNPVGAASAGVTVTDVNGDGATLSVEGGANSMYLASFDQGLGSAGDFASLLTNTVTAGAFQSASASDEFPGNGGMIPLGQPIENMLAEWKFTVSPFDLASGTSTFVVVPAPVGLGLLGVAGLAAIRRRR